MSSYFDEKSRRVAEASASSRFVEEVIRVEQEVIQDVTLVAGDREFPQDLREKAMSIIAIWHIGTYAALVPRPEAVEMVTVMRMSELVERMHSLFHEVASRRIFTRFGMLSDHPADILHRRDGY